MALLPQVLGRPVRAAALGITAAASLVLLVLWSEGIIPPHRQHLSAPTAIRIAGCSGAVRKSAKLMPLSAFEHAFPLEPGPAQLSRGDWVWIVACSTPSRLDPSDDSWGIRGVRDMDKPQIPPDGFGVVGPAGQSWPTFFDGLPNRDGALPPVGN